MKIGCVLVLYNPNLLLLREVLNAVQNQVGIVYIADNSSSGIESDIFLDKNNIVYEKMKKNVGIAAAQNFGIKFLIQQKYTHVIFLDQDSIMDRELINQLVLDLDYLQSKSIYVGAIGPRPVNRESNKKYIGSIKRGKPVTANITEVTEIISSASLICLDNFIEIGLLDESLFIDGVDHEWCWRAKKIKKLRFFISEKTFLSHKLGEGDQFFLIRKVKTPTPFRTYFQFRNYFILLRRNYVPIYWKVSNGFKYSIKLFYYPVFIKPRKEYLKNILYGIKDGIFNGSALAHFHD